MIEFDLKCKCGWEGLLIQANRMVSLLNSIDAYCPECGAWLENYTGEPHTIKFGGEDDG